MSALAVDPVRLEENLATRLRNCRLVFEILDDATIEETLGVVAWLSRQSPDPVSLLAARYRAVLSAYLVSEAIEKYEGGTFWPHLSLPTKQADQTALGTAFIEALGSFGLDTFEFLSVQGLKYVTPILAHAGIPRYCVGDFFHRLLIPQLRRGFGASAGELLAAWRARQTAFVGIDVPVKRFVLYGGSPAVDLVDRCIDLIAEAAGGSLVRPADFGLPRHMVEGLKFDPGETEQAQKLRFRAVPLPHVRIDPWDPLGPVLELPPLPRDLEEPSWLVEDGTAARSVTGSKVQGHLHRLGPARSWAAELRSARGTLRTSVFERLPETGVATFDPETGLLARDPRVVPWVSAWFLVPTDTSLRFLDGERHELEPRVTELPPPAGLWNGHSFGEYDLTRVASIEAQRTTKAGPRIETLRVVPRDETRAILEGPFVEGVTTEDGLPVYAQLPRVVFPGDAVPAPAWKLQIRYGGKAVDTTAAEAGYPRADLHGWIGDIAVARIQIRVTGPIGSDLRAEFAVVSGLRVVRPDGVILPGGHTSAHVSVQASEGVGLQAPGGGSSTSLVIGPNEDLVSCWADGGAGERLLLLVAVPRLVWAIARCDATGHQLGTTVERLALDELHGDKNADGAAAVIVSTRCPGLPLGLRLQCRGAELALQSQKTSRDGRAAFLLAPLRDAAVASGAATLRIDLLVSGRIVHAATLFARLRLSNLECQLIDGTQGQELAIAFEADVQFSNLEVRVWPAHRPWESQPIRTLALPAGASSGTSLPLAEPPCPPGRYLVEVAIHDEWQPAARPRSRAPNTVVCNFGDAQSHRADLHRQAKVDAAAALELLLIEGMLVRDLSSEERYAITPLALTALLDRLREPDNGDSGPTTALRDLLALHPGLTASALGTVFASGSVEGADALGAVISLLPLAGGNREPGWSEARSAWVTVPYLAAQLEVPAASEGDVDAVARCQEFLDWEPGSPPVRGVTNSNESLAPPQAALGASPEVLDLIRGASDLLPGPLLTLDEFAAAGFEWLIRGNAGSRARRWWEEYQLIPSLVPPSGELAQYHLQRRAPPPGVSAWAGLPQITLAACLALLDGREVRRARLALMEAVQFAPRLVAFDLALAAVLRTAARGTRGPDQNHA